MWASFASIVDSNSIANLKLVGTVKIVGRYLIIVILSSDRMGGSYTGNNANARSIL